VYSSEIGGNREEIEEVGAGREQQTPYLRFIDALDRLSWLMGMRDTLRREMRL